MKTNLSTRQKFLLNALLSEDPTHWDLADAAAERESLAMVANLTNEEIQGVMDVVRLKIEKGRIEAREMIRDE